MIAAPRIETGRLSLRAPCAADWDAWASFARSDRACFVGGPYTLGGAWRAFAHVVGHWVLRGFGMFVVTLRGSSAPLGMAGPWHPADWPEPEIAWSLWSAEAEGKGYAFEATIAAREHARTALGWHRPVSYIVPQNARSIRLARRLGATHDPEAAAPPGSACLVWRHPAAEAAA